MFAVIKAGGKQFRVAANDVIRIEKIAGQPGDVIELGPVLMLSGDKGVEIGNPVLSGASVTAEVLGQERGETIIIFKKRRRHHYRRRNGHRQSMTAVRINEILTDGRKPVRRGKASKAPASKGQIEEKAAEE
jgi:large subunit ribosomal protein L21